MILNKNTGGINQLLYHELSFSNHRLDQLAGIGRSQDVVNFHVYYSGQQAHETWGHGILYW